MRPLYAIAPLAILLALFGPVPHEADKAWADFKARFMGTKDSQLTEAQSGQAGAKHGAMEGGSRNADVAEVSYQR